MNMFRLYYKLPFFIKRRILRLYKYMPNRNKIVIKEIDGIKYELDLSELIDISMYYYGWYEPETTEIIKKEVKEGMTVFDIGANVGCHALRFAKQVGDKGKVYAFEPTTYALNKLKRRIKLNNFKNLYSEKIALSDKNETKEGYFKSSFKIVKDNNTKIKEKMVFMKLDEYVETKNIKRIDFIKIDVDGFECKILRGGMKTLKKFKPTMLVEFGLGSQEEQNDSLEELVSLLESIGYNLYSEKDGHKFENVLEEMPTKTTMNVVCKCV